MTNLRGARWEEFQAARRGGKTAVFTHEVTIMIPVLWEILVMPPRSRPDEMAGRNGFLTLLVWSKQIGCGAVY